MPRLSCSRTGSRDYEEIVGRRRQRTSCSAIATREATTVAHAIATSDDLGLHDHRRSAPGCALACVGSAASTPPSSRAHVEEGVGSTRAPLPWTTALAARRPRAPQPGSLRDVEHVLADRLVRRAAQPRARASDGRDAIRGAVECHHTRHAHALVRLAHIGPRAVASPPALAASPSACQVLHLWYHRAASLSTERGRRPAARAVTTQSAFTTVGRSVARVWHHTRDYRRRANQ